MREFKHVQIPDRNYGKLIDYRIGEVVFGRILFNIGHKIRQGVWIGIGRHIIDHADFKLRMLNEEEED